MTEDKTVVEAGSVTMDKGMPKGRNQGIEALRIVSMFLIVVMHTLKQGGVLVAANGSTAHFYLAWFLEVIAFCAVDCYALISGYVGVQARFRWSRPVKLWLQVVFYTVLITLFFQICYPSGMNYKYWLKALFPVLSREYWYISCYFGLMIFMPVLNEGIKALPVKQLRNMVIAAVVLFCVLPVLLQGYPFNFNPEADYFGLLNGYSVLWLMVLYLIGAYIRVSDRVRQLKGRKIVAGALAAVLLTWGAFVFLPEYTLKRFGEVRYSAILLNYTSPTILLVAVAFLLLFERKQSWNRVVDKVIGVMAPATLGVYLIHTHPLIWDSFMKDYAISFAEGTVLGMVGKVLAASAGIYLVCTCVDLVRGWIFKSVVRIMNRE